MTETTSSSASVIGETPLSIRAPLMSEKFSKPAPEIVSLSAGVELSIIFTLSHFLCNPRYLKTHECLDVC